MTMPSLTPTQHAQKTERGVRMGVILLIALVVAHLPSPSLCFSFIISHPSSKNIDLPRRQRLSACSSNNDSIGENMLVSSQKRRKILISPFTAATIAVASQNKVALADADDGQLPKLLDQIKEGRQQLEDIPELIKAEKWDAVRAILIKPPLSNMWTSGGANKLLNNYADALGSLPDGDEIAALELREEIISHLRYLDMAVYNNVFNPIGSEGTTGATKELIRSYYEDPINELTASRKAIDELIKLASQQ